MSDTDEYFTRKMLAEIPAQIFLLGQCRTCLSGGIRRLLRHFHHYLPLLTLTNNFQNLNNNIFALARTLFRQ